MRLEKRLGQKRFINDPRGLNMILTGDLHASPEELRFLKPEYQPIFKTN